MPKDKTHWILAAEISNRLRDEHIKRVISNNYASFLVGAIAYDIPFFGRGKYSHVLTEKANELHGVKTCDVWEPIIKLLESYGDDCRETVIAFAVGCITHIIIDSQFHPFIYFFTGYYEADGNKRNHAIVKHREIEAHLDLYYLEKTGYTGPVSAKVIVEQLHRPTLITNLALLYFGNTGAKEVDMTQNCLNNYIKYQGLFSNYFIKCLLRIVGLANDEMKKISALFYPKSIEPTYRQLFDNIEWYQHPSSGKVIEESLKTIYENCIEVMVSTIYQFSSCKTIEDYLNVIRNFPAVSLETGSECARPSLMRFFS
ncbi:hypothetical protein SOV_19940 [Sporomusa ovata DSM 2662]|uniref:Phospholipase C/D domain-containing protein n=1 Tax=Sporomusa ovata TaxID=2378 RepID=A0A0U1KXW5_9FIRM|nr:zinc dependent phospholipase C family protein [Sporomusa ovata]EQB29592.1 zinc dependent phospholipase C [Sporomusa ovata DSM 2662]CQR72105.1 hypothetical protein SpAn4DRAFT_4794 [Sporomusa ovata]